MFFESTIKQQTVEDEEWYKEINVHLEAVFNSLPARLWPIMRKFLPIMLLNSAQKVTHYAQYYVHNYFNYATVQPQILIF